MTSSLSIGITRMWYECFYPTESYVKYEAQKFGMWCCCEESIVFQGVSLVIGKCLLLSISQPERHLGPEVVMNAQTCFKNGTSFGRSGSQEIPSNCLELKMKDANPQDCSIIELAHQMTVSLAGCSRDNPPAERLGVIARA